MLKKILIMIGIMLVLIIVMWMIYSPKNVKIPEYTNKPKQQINDKTVLDSEKKKVVKIKTDKKIPIKETKIKELTPKETGIQARYNKAWTKRKIYTADEINARIDRSIITESSVGEWSKDKKVNTTIKACISELQKALGYVDDFLEKKDYEVSYFNGFYSGITIEGPEELDVWRIMLAHKNISCISTIDKRKKLSTGWPLEFSITFYKGTLVPDYINFSSFKDKGEVFISFFNSGKIQYYSQKSEDSKKYIVRWQEDGKIKVEKSIDSTKPIFLPYPRKKKD